MRKAKKRGEIRITAYQLTDDTLLKEGQPLFGKVKSRTDGRYEVMSREAVLGNSGNGQLAEPGDYIKLDQKGEPYPNTKEYFEAQHVKVGDHEYLQIPEERFIWTPEEPMCPEVEFLLREKGLELHPGTPETFYSAVLWGTLEKAAKDAFLVFYSIDRAEDGSITDASFNFVAGDEFEKTYEIVG